MINIGHSTSLRRPVFARWFPLASRAMESGGMAEHREQLLCNLTADTVVEVGPGTGANFAHYPETARRVIAVEPEPHLRTVALEAAEKAAEKAGVSIEVVDGIAERLPLEDESADAAVVTFVLCSVTDLARTLSELRRVVRPGGELRFLEHVRADTPALAGVQRALDATIWPRLVGNCHLGLNSAAAIAEAGFEQVEYDEFLFPDGRRTPMSFHIRGRAARPAGRGTA